MACPVSFEEFNAAVGETALDIGAVENDTLVDLAGETPVGREVDEYGFAFREILLEQGRAVGLPVGLAGCGAAGGLRWRREGGRGGGGLQS